VTRNRLFLVAGVLVALLLAGAVSFYASGSPDGLAKVAADKGISANERAHSLADSPVAGYAVKGVDNGRLAKGLAGAAGVLITLGGGGALFVGLSRRARSTTQPAASPGQPES
jgi:hypothetical protein